jgi:hypothetical protein
MRLEALEDRMMPVVFTVINSNDAGVGSFRQAIIDANTIPGPDDITFASGVTSLTPTATNGPYPSITSEVRINGINSGNVRVQLNGAGLAGDGLVFAGGSFNSSVVGLAINGFGGSGIVLAAGTPTALAGNTTVANNFIGTDTTGTVARPNGARGISVSSSGNTIGGTTTGSRNIISGNTGGGISFFSTSAANNVVLGNFIGPDISGNRPLPNTGFGVIINSAGSNTIGGTTASARNIISANAAGGVLIQGTTATNNVVQGNYIGVDTTGANTLGNANDGILIIDGATNNLIGGAAGVGGNTIGFNGGFNLNFAGVSVANATPGSGNVNAGTGNAILSNSIFSNGGLGIDIGTNGIDLNDPLDADTGPNNLQNYPLLFQASSITGSGMTRIQGTLNSTANTTFTVQFFDNTQAPDPSGFGEGGFFIGQATVTTNATGVGVFDVSLPRSTFVGNFITATATDAGTIGPELLPEFRRPGGDPDGRAQPGQRRRPPDLHGHRHQ